MQDNRDVGFEVFHGGYYDEYRLLTFLIELLEEDHQYKIPYRPRYLSDPSWPR
jgi:hypothetical protein